MDKNALARLAREFRRKEGLLFAGDLQPDTWVDLFFKTLPKLKGAIKLALSSVPQAPALEPEIRAILQEVKTDRTQADKLFHEMRKIAVTHAPTLGITEDAELEEFAFLDDPNWVSSDEFREIADVIADQVDPTSYTIRKSHIGILVTGQNVPDIVQRQFERIKACYIFGFHDAAVIYCRALVEAALKDVLEAALQQKRETKVELPPRSAKREKVKNLMLDTLIQLAETKEIVQPEMIETIKTIQKYGNKAAHGRDVDKGSRSVIAESIAVIETLYAETKH